MQPHLLVVVNNVDGEHSKDAVVIAGELLFKSKLLPQPDSTRISEVMSEHVSFTDAKLTSLGDLNDWLKFRGSSWKDLGVDLNGFTKKVNSLQRAHSIDGSRFEHLRQPAVDLLDVDDDNTQPVVGAIAMMKENQRHKVRTYLGNVVFNRTQGNGHSANDLREAPMVATPIHIETSHDLRENGKVIARLKAAVDLSTTEHGRGHVTLVTVQGQTLLDADDMEFEPVSLAVNFEARARFALQFTLEAVLRDCDDPIEVADFPEARDWVAEHRSVIDQSMAELSQTSGSRAVSALEGPSL